MIQSNINEIIMGLNDLEKKQIPYATSKALNDTAFQARAALTAQLVKRLDNPTPFTKRAIRVRKATKKRLYAEVYVNEIQAKYLKNLYYGGTERPKSRALIKPTKDLKLNKYGNIQNKKIQKLLNNPNYFSGTVTGKGGKRSGIFRRYKSGRIKQMIMWVDKKEKQKRLEFDKTIQGVVNNKFNSNFEKALKFAISTMK